MSEKDEKKYVDIFSLFAKEKIETFKDDKGNESQVLFIKMTQGELVKALTLYNEESEKEKVRIKENKTEIDLLRRMIQTMDKKTRVESILLMEEPYREQMSNLYPVEDEAEKTAEQKEKERKAELKSWRKNREKELLAETDEETEEKLINLRIESQAVVKGSILVNNFSISCMARHPETREKIFNTPEDVFKLNDRSIIDKMTEIVQQFRENMSEEKIRDVAQSENFQESGQSQES